MSTAAHGEIRVDLNALRAFVTRLETEFEATLASRSSQLEARFFPSGRDAEARHFGRSAHHATAAAIGTAQHANAAAHLDRLAQARDGLTIARQVAHRLLERYRDLDEQQEITAAALTATLAEVRELRSNPEVG